jgi:hypothetical protein
MTLDAPHKEPNDLSLQRWGVIYANTEAGKRAFEAGAVADGDLVEGAVAQNLQCVGGAIDRCGGRRFMDAGFHQQA